MKVKNNNLKEISFVCLLIYFHMQVRSRETVCGCVTQNKRHTLHSTSVSRRGRCAVALTPWAQAWGVWQLSGEHPSHHRQDLNLPIYHPVCTTIVTVFVSFFRNFFLPLHASLSFPGHAHRFSQGQTDSMAYYPSTECEFADPSRRTNPTPMPKVW